MSLMTYACPASEFVPETHLLKLQCLHNKDLHTTGNFTRCTLVLDLYTAFNLPYASDNITKLYTQQAEAIQSHNDEHVCSKGQGEARQRKYKRVKLSGSQAYNYSSK
jgi:hypothetical protein